MDEEFESKTLSCQLNVSPLYIYIYLYIHIYILYILRRLVGWLAGTDILFLSTESLCIIGIKTINLKLEAITLSCLWDMASLPLLLPRTYIF